MAELIHNYYRVYYHTSGMYSPVMKQKHLIHEINTSLLHTGIEQLKITIIPVEMSETEWIDRPNELKHYGDGGKEN